MLPRIRRGTVGSLGLSSIAVVSLGLAIGANIVAWLLVERSRTYSLPFRETERLASVWRSYEWDSSGGFPAAEFPVLRDNARTLSGLAAAHTLSVNFQDRYRPERLQAQFVSPNYFRLLGLRPRLGRVFSGDRNEGPVVILSYGLWQKRFGGRESVLGSTIRLEGRPHVVVGVMPPSATVVGRGADLWLILDRDRSLDRVVTLIGRLKEGVSSAAAEAELESIHERFLGANPEEDGSRIRVESLVDAYLDGHLQEGVPVRQRVHILFGLLGFVLLIACLNVANHLAMRTVKRQREFAVRLALGAGRGRILTQLVSEGVGFVVASAILGTALAVWVVHAAVWAQVSDVFQDLDQGLRPTLILYVALLCLVCTLLCSSGSLVAGARRLSLSRLVGGSDPWIHPRRRVPLANLFVGLQIVVSLALALSAASLIYAAWRIDRLPMGFEPSGVLKMVVWMPREYTERLSQEFPDDPYYRILPRWENFFRESTERIEAIPGVAGVGSTDDFGCGEDSIQPFRLEGQSNVGPRDLIHRFQEVCYKPVNLDYFSALGIRNVKGRTFTANDLQAPRTAVVVNRSLANRYWPGEEPLGKRLQLVFPDCEDFDRYPWSEVVGVVVVGVNGVTVFSSQLRKHELSVRMAAGGTPRSLARTVLRPLMRLALFAFPAGVGAGIAIVGYLGSLLQDIVQPPIGLILLAALITAIVIALSGLLPASRIAASEQLIEHLRSGESA